MPRVLVVDDEPAIRWLIVRALSAHGYEVAEAGDGPSAVAALAWSPDLIVLDLLLPGLDGHQVLAEVRRQGDTPVIMLSALAGEADRVAGLDDGADDYLVKPFSLAELEARVRALLRRSSPRPHDADAPLHIDQAAREVTLDGSPVSLTRREFDLLAYLADRPRQVVGPAELLEQVWHSSMAWQDPHTVKEHVRRLRLKLTAGLIRTVRGTGYLFDPEVLSRQSDAATDCA
ncbi:MAG TPA: response regulator transcription factor [Acidimicrobiales bacterium]|jgi:DNA-binding response OmpR family regulator|nr:response regulator transcription factor [Acidimicrobiales bacterium]